MRGEDRGGVEASGHTAAAKRAARWRLSAGVPHRTFFAFPMQVWKVLYTTNAIESLHMQMRKIVKSRGYLPSDEAALKLLYLARTKLEQKWRSGASVE